MKPDDESPPKDTIRPVHEIRKTLPHGYIVVGNGIYATCPLCGQLVRLNKPIFGSLHLCR